MQPGRAARRPTPPSQAAIPVSRSTSPPLGWKWTLHPLRSPSIRTMGACTSASWMGQLQVRPFRVRATTLSLRRKPHRRPRPPHGGVRRLRFMGTSFRRSPRTIWPSCTISLSKAHHRMYRPAVVLQTQSPSMSPRTLGPFPQSSRPWANGGVASPMRPGSPCRRQRSGPIPTSPVWNGRP